MTWNKRHKLLRRVFSTVMALVLAVSLLPTYAFAASVPTSTTTDGNTADFTGAWKSAHYKPGTYTVTANLAMPGQYNPILTGVTIRKVPGKTGIDLDNTTIEVIKLDLEPYGYTLDMNEQVKVISIGNLGLLCIVTTDPTIQSIQNLAGRTVYSIGEGGPPEYTFEYMLEQYHLIGQVNFYLRSTPFEDFDAGSQRFQVHRMARHGAGLWQGRVDEIKDPYAWGSSTVAGILKKREYLGHTVNFKTRKHFKDKKSHYVSEDNWTVFEDTQEAIIDQETFDNVQRIRKNVRRYPDGWGEAHPLTGLMYCADCGAKMYVHRVNNGKRIPQYTCSAYSKIPVGTLCPTQHRINADIVMELIKDLLKAIAEYSHLNREEFIETVKTTQSSQQSSEIVRLKNRLAEAKKRLQELEKLICRIYEDNILGKLPDERYTVLDGQYSKEQKELTAEISELEAEVAGYENSRRSAERFIALIDKYQNFDELTTYMLNEFVEKILVHERDRKGSRQTTQEIEIYFNFVGRYLPPHFGEVQLTPEEEEELRKREARKDRLHQNYLRRKANGKQKEYEDKVKEKKKAEIEAKKEAIRQEDIAKGVFVPVAMLPTAEPKKGVASV